MKTQLHKSSRGYTLTEGGLDVTRSCYALLTLLWKLGVIKCDGDDVDAGEVWIQHRQIVEMLSQLYIEQQFMGRKK